MTTRTLAIDWEFISRHEGGCRLTGYVPPGSRCGVTIATGFDLGQRTPNDIQALDLPDMLKARLVIYCGATGDIARTAATALPLRITAIEGHLLDRTVSTDIFRKLESAYDAATNDGAFAALPGALQTAIASVAYQYGPTLAKAAPKFWAAAVAQDWAACVNELENFGDHYPRRRQSEADLIRTGTSLA